MLPAPVDLKIYDLGILWYEDYDAILYHYSFLTGTRLYSLT